MQFGGFDGANGSLHGFRASEGSAQFHDPGHKGLRFSSVI